MTSHEHFHRQHLPPSPPPSPPTTRKRHKKRVSSFDKFANTPLPLQPSSSSNEPLADQNDDSLLKRIILTPILFTSFLLSLAVVNLRDRARRSKSHSSLLTYFYPLSWLDPEPYQDPDDSRWCRGGKDSHVEPHGALGPKDAELDDKKTTTKRESWHLNKNIRKIARLEIGDAFEMRGRVIVGMVVALVMGLAMLLVAVKWVLLLLAGKLSGWGR